MICPICKKRKGCIPVTEKSKNVKERAIEICEKCDLNLYDAGTLQKKMLKEINIQLRHHRKEKNIYAVNSLLYLKEVLLE